MKILAFGDLHEDYSYAEELSKKAKNVDILVCAGDLSIFGDGLENAINFLDNLGKKVICIHGNHESENRMRRLCEKTKNVIFIHKKFCIVNDIVIIGYGGGGFSKEEEGFIEVEQTFSHIVKNNKKSILLTHAPPHDTKLDKIPGEYHVGCKTFRRFIIKNQPSVAISGHIHDTFKKIDKLGKTILVNPGPGGAIINI